MSVYAVFAGEDYYPNGGWHDFVSAHDTLAAATDAARDHIVARASALVDVDWWHVVRLDIRAVVASWENH